MLDLAGALIAHVGADPIGRWSPTPLVAGWRDRVGAGLLAFAMWFDGARRRTATSRAGAADTTVRRFEIEILPHIDAAYDLARYLCGDADVAEDVVQEACLRAFRAVETRQGGSPRAWLLAIVRNCHLDWRDRVRRAPTAHAQTADGEDDPLEAIAATGDPEADLLRRSEAQAVREVLATLPEAVREILVLRDIEDCSYREIAEILDVPIGTVMSRLARARKAFAVRWTALSRGGVER
ncbi:sigma-70 family RNA polymerase sigma factor [Siculibacillus lacustris]|uniref:RNA polymerase sigma factor n=1 Tax=Siculibacillus lacustris TaxID=1549641 RepID=A0A4Q9VMH5_9HYPH|nr:sigma-70 family RNA polymerase sigma factor [Siculibacillus lacustris]TBW36803.1 sigma-70 family RNA polymerase sigma factor [Siculibacillus lacustris]